MRLKALSVALALGMLAPFAHAGLGEVRVLSAAGEPFLAEIPVLDEPGMLGPYASLASSQQYPFLGSYSAKAFQLKILTVEDQPGHYMIRIMGPVMNADEALDFALELAWAAGREVRAYHATPTAQQAPQRQDASAAGGDMPAAVPADNILAFGEARLLSRHGAPLLAEVPLLGQWPDALGDQDFVLQRTASTPDDGITVHYHQEQQRRWLTLEGAQPLLADELAFVLETRARGLLVARSFRIPLQLAPGQLAHVPRQPKLAGKHALHRVQPGETLSLLVSGMAHGLHRRNELALQVVRDNPHAFIDGNPNRMLAGALLQLPQASHARQPQPAHARRQQLRKAAPAPTPQAAPQPLPKPLPKPAAAPPLASPQPALADAASSAKAAPATSAASEAASQAQEQQRIRHLHEAQTRINKLEAEIQRIASGARGQPSPHALPATAHKQHDDELMSALDDWILTGVGGASVLSLLAWAIWRRRKQQTQEEQASQQEAQELAAQALRQRAEDALVPVADEAPAATQPLAMPSEPAMLAFEEPELATMAALAEEEAPAMRMPSEVLAESQPPLLAADDAMLELPIADELAPQAAAAEAELPETMLAAAQADDLTATAEPEPAQQAEAVEPDPLEPAPLEQQTEPVPEAMAQAFLAPEPVAQEPIAQEAEADAEPLAATDGAVTSAAAAAPAAQPQSVAEVLAEVDIQMLYGRREEAQQLLRSALQQDPQAEALRVRLLQLLAEAGAREAFEAEALDVLAMTGGEGALWPRVQQLGASFDPANLLYRSTEAPPAPPITQTAPPREPVRQVVRRVSGNEAVPMAELAETDDETAALAELYREMGDKELAEALLKGNSN
ncbi:hypothetical protein [Vogesella sp. LIG4]|uniref:FimV/HubP-related protein n=1 Tax=Vogesella sp. LIG4 TaxID=1192162 RepID=UPI00081F9460|nr:hypothetical protein [Vogesella sp. LIG4]SCK29944.1 hypothetical protein PSELUDRAFT_3706 [Vogesella sp. LIG4]